MKVGFIIPDFSTIGNVRLSIIDIASGQQPLSDHSGRYWIVLNGEIFNYRELKGPAEGERIYLSYNIRH